MNEVLKSEISNLSISDLSNLVGDINTEIAERQEKALNDARLQVRQLAESLGVSLEELIADPSKPEKTVKKAEVKFRHPDNKDQIWTGRGKQPRWLVAAIEGGAKLEDFAV